MGAAAVPILIGTTLLSTYASVQASRANAEGQKRAAAAEAQRAAIAANNAEAVASVNVAETGRKIQLAISRARAFSAANGAAVPEEYFAAIAERGAEQQELTRWQGRTQGGQLRDAGALATWKADAAGEVAKQQQHATILGGAAQVGGIAYKYGGGAPGGTTPTVGGGMAEDYGRSMDPYGLYFDNSGPGRA
jgi:hypothetical protein